MPALFRAEVLKAALWFEIPAGAEFIHSGETEGGLFAGADGVVEIAFPGARPDMRALHLARPGFWAGQRPLLGRARTLSVTARTDVLQALVPLAAMRKLLAAEPAGWEHVAQPGEDCAELRTDATWNDSPCADAKAYVCEGG